MSNLAYLAVDSHFNLHRLGKLVLILALLSMAFFITAPVTAKSYIYRVVREISKIQMMWQTRGWQEIDGPNFIVRYQPQDDNTAKMVLNVAEKSYKPVTDSFGFAPRSKTLIVIYPTKESLSRSFGWTADESAMGVYWAGVIRILSPNAWVGETDPAQFTKVFENEGPVAHELTHLIVDYKTGGNYTRWLTEGIAQYEEAKVTGYHMDHEKIVSPEELYPLSKMDGGFDNLEDQNLAYYESLQAVRYMVMRYGESSIDKVLTNLGRGRTMDQSFRDVLGVSTNQFEKDFKIWAVANQ